MADAAPGTITGKGAADDMLSAWGDEQAPEPEESVLPVSFRGVRLDEARLAAYVAVGAAMLGIGPRKLEPVEIMRFLEARDWDVEQATLMLKDNVTWRDATLPVERTPGVVDELKKGKCYLRGKAKNGNPIVYVNSCKFDPNERDLENAVNAVVYMMEEGIQAFGGLGSSAGVMLVYNRTGFTMSNWDKAFLQMIARMFQDNYPEVMVSAIVYPCGLMFRGLWKVAQFFLDPKTREKFIMAPDENCLLEHIDAAELPVALGGKDTWEFDPSTVKA